MISVIDGSFSSGSSGPKPVISWIISSTSLFRSSRVTAKRFSEMTRSTMPSILDFVSVAVPSRSESKAAMIWVCISTRISFSIPSRVELRGPPDLPASGTGMTAGRFAPGGGGASATGTSTGGFVPFVSGRAGAAGSVAVAAASAACAALSCRSSSDIRWSVPPPQRVDATNRSIRSSRVSPSGINDAKNVERILPPRKCSVGSEVLVGRRWDRSGGAGPRGPLLCSALRQGAIAQLEERLNGIQKVKGSNPFSSTTSLPIRSCAAVRRVVQSATCR